MCGLLGPICCGDNNMEGVLGAMLANRIFWIIFGAVVTSGVSSIKKVLDQNFAALDKLSGFEW